VQHFARDEQRVAGVAEQEAGVAPEIRPEKDGGLADRQRRCDQDAAGKKVVADLRNQITPAGNPRDGATATTATAPLQP
jgi:hypothetical protein